MRILLVVLYFGLFPVLPRPHHLDSPFRYERTITLPTAPDAATACAILDAAVYAHAEPSLKDLRLFQTSEQASAEVPYAITLSESAETDTEAAAVRNLGQRGEQVVFDLVMPGRPYTDVQLDLDAHNFIATAEVTGGDGRAAPSTDLGTFTLFDLTAQHMGRGTTLPLQESSFPILHVALRFSPAAGTSDKAPAMATVRGASVPPSREAQTLYTVVAETPNIVQQGSETVATLPLPAHVPVERVSLVLESGFAGNFSRDVTVTAHASGEAGDGERLSGRVERVRLERAGREIRQEQLGFPATLGANLQEATTVQVRIQNGDDPPPPLSAVRLEMRERRLCFPITQHTTPLTLFYGDPTLEAPRYDFAQLFSLSAHLVRATLSPESLNALYTGPPTQQRSLTERYPELLWVVLLGVICVLATVALHSAKRMQR